MTENFKELFVEHLEKQETLKEKFLFIDRLLKFYYEYISIIKDDLEKMKHDLIQESDNGQTTFSLVTSFNLEENITTEVELSKKEEEKKTKDLINWILEQRYRLDNGTGK